MTGGAGTDYLSGSTGADTFDFNALSELGLGTTRDVISDFKQQSWIRLICQVLMPIVLWQAIKRLALSPHLVLLMQQGRSGLLVGYYKSVPMQIALLSMK